jgi:hypothetical protein
MQIDPGISVTDAIPSFQALAELGIEQPAEDKSKKDKKKKKKKKDDEGSIL